MQRVHGDHARGQPEFAEQALDGRDLVGLVVDLEMAQHQGAVGGEGADQVGRPGVGELVEAAAQRLAVEGDHAHALARGVLVEDRRMQAEHLLDVGRRETLKDPAHRGVSRRTLPVQPERLLEPGQVDIEEAVDRAVGIGPRHDREDREQKHVGQPVKLAFRPTGIGDTAQHGEQVGECGVHGNHPWFRLPGIDSQKSCRENPTSYSQTHFVPNLWHIGLTSNQER